MLRLLVRVVTMTTSSTSANPYISYIESSPGMTRLRNELHLPTTISSLSEACGLAFFHRSIVNSVELELNIDVSELMRAARTTDIISPRAPVQLYDHQ